MFSVSFPMAFCIVGAECHSILCGKKEPSVEHITSCLGEGYLHICLRRLLIFVCFNNRLFLCSWRAAKNCESRGLWGVTSLRSCPEAHSDQSSVEATDDRPNEGLPPPSTRCVLGCAKVYKILGVSFIFHVCVCFHLVRSVLCLCVAWLCHNSFGIVSRIAREFHDQYSDLFCIFQGVTWHPMVQIDSQ